MKRDFLEELGIEKETINKILDQNGQDLEDAKAKVQSEMESKVEDITAKFNAANTTLEELQKKNIDGIEQELTDYKTRYETLEKEVKARDYQESINTYLSKYNFTSNLAKQAVAAQMQEKAFAVENGKIQGADEFMAELVTNNPEAFVPKDPEGDGVKPSVPKFVGPGPTEPGHAPMAYTKEALAKMSPAEINAHWKDIQGALKNI